MMSLLEKVLRYWRVHGTRKLIVESLVRMKMRRDLPVALGASVSARQFVNAQHSATLPLRLTRVPEGDANRISMVTDSINGGSLYGGVGTAMIFSALIAESRGARLRIVTRAERANPDGLESVLETYGIHLSKAVEFAHAPCRDGGYDIDTRTGELFITTSWWTTCSTLASVPAESIIYLLQEDERMFYPYGDEHLRCSQVLQRTDIRFVINTRLLFDHLVETGLTHLRSTGLSFEPAFPASVFHPRTQGAAARRTLMLYARPHNPRNLFLFGLELLETAIARGILNLESWDIVLVGNQIPKVRFDEGRYAPSRLENLNWREYVDLVGRIDLGVCLMYTPHPSYPPFDLAASGAVAVTNRFGRKQNLDDRSRNIVCGDLTMPSMLAALADGLRLACNSEERAANHRANTLGSDWQTSFAEVVYRCGRDRDSR